MTDDARELLARIGTALYEPDVLTRQDADDLYAALESIVLGVEWLHAETLAHQQDAEDAEKGAAACDQIVALLDGIPIEAPCPEAARVVALLSERDRMRDLVRHQRGALYDAGLLTEAEYATLAADSAAVARLEGYDALRAGLANIEQIVRDGMAVARAEVERLRGERAAERAAVVAYLHWGSDPLLDDAADAIERGEHRREKTP